MRPRRERPLSCLLTPKARDTSGEWDENKKVVDDLAGAGRRRLLGSGRDRPGVGFGWNAPRLERPHPFEGWGYCTSAGPMCFGPTAPNYDIWTVAPDGTGLINVTRAPGADADAAWSPDGEMLAFNSNRNGSYDIFLTRSAWE